MLAVELQSSDNSRMSEFRLKSGYETFDYTTAYRTGNGVYLAEGQTFDEVVAKDRAILETHGVTQEQIGASLGKLFATWNDFIEIRDPQPQYPLPGVMLTRQVYLLGQECCPYVPGLYSGVNWHVFVDGMRNGNKAVHPLDGPTFVSEMMPEMIAKTGFFEGDVFFGIDPSWAVAVHKLVEEHDPQPYVPTLTKEAWDYVHKKISKEKTEIDDIFTNRTEEIDFAPGIWAFIAPGEIAPWGWAQWEGGQRKTPKAMAKSSQFSWGESGKKRLEKFLETRTEAWCMFVNRTGEDFRLQPDATLLGIPFDKYVSRIPDGVSYGRYMPDRPALKQIA